MALKTKANIKTALDNAAADLTLAYADTVSGLAVQMQNPKTALRQIQKLFAISDAGVVTVDANAYNALFGAADLYRDVVAQGSNTLVKKVIA